MDCTSSSVHPLGANVRTLAPHGRTLGPQGAQVSTQGAQVSTQCGQVSTPLGGKCPDTCTSWADKPSSFLCNLHLCLNKYLLRLK